MANKASNSLAKNGISIGAKAGASIKSKASGSAAQNLPGIQTKIDENSLTGVQPDPRSGGNPDDDKDWSWLGGGGGWGYGGGGGGSTGPSDDTVAAGQAQKPLAAYGYQTIANKVPQAKKVYAINDQGSKNSRDFQAAQAEKRAGVEYFSNLLKEQSAYDANRDKMGNARYGAGALDLNTDMQRAHDATAASILENIEFNQADIDADYYKSLQSSVNGWNEFIMDTEAKAREGVANYVAQMNNLHPDLANGKEDGFEKLVDTSVVDKAGKNATAADIAKGIKVPKWLNTNFFNKNVRGPIEYLNRQQIRPAAATQKAVSQSLMHTGTNLSSAANKSYWNALTTDYGHRKV